VSVRQALRAATAGHHERVDAIFGTFDLARLEDYGRFLLAQASAFLPLEAELDRQNVAAVVADWPLRRRAAHLRSDLSDLGLEIPTEMRVAALADTGAQLGTIYVLEGSRLGGAFLKRSLPADRPQSFLGASRVPGAWPKLLEILDENLYGSVRIGLACDAAQAAFALFEAAGRQYLEADRA
jgi:heme oxygenase